jgi:hypothetical protein
MGVGVATSAQYCPELMKGPGPGDSINQQMSSML